MDTFTLDQVVDMAMKLPLDQREMLVDVIQWRQVEALRSKIAADASTAHAAYHAGRSRPQPADDIIRDLSSEAV